MEDTSGKIKTFSYNRGNRGRGATIFQLTDSEIDKVAPMLRRITTTADAIRYLYSQGWSNGAICKVLTYPTDTDYHKAGDPLLPQHAATTISKYFQELKNDPESPAIRGMMFPPERTILLPPSEGMEVDVNPKRETLEEIESSAVEEITEEDELEALEEEINKLDEEESVEEPQEPQETQEDKKDEEEARKQANYKQSA